MNTHIKVENPGKITFTLTLTLELQEWQRLAKQFANHSNEWPASRVIDCILDMTEKAQKQFYPESIQKEMRPDGC